MMGRVTRQPLLWVAATAGMAATGDKGKRAALRGTGCYLVGAAVGNLPKPLFGRPQPRHRWARKPQVIRGAFPSGHACAEVAFVFGASQEAPVAFWPFGTMAMLAHLSLTRDGKHYVTDTLVGGTIGVLIALYAAKRWPTEYTRRIGLNGSQPERRQPVPAS
ncbi:MAG TPA: phosphatase PAP2 family protein [Chloroflexia bacterium]|nr:phosphatase PAP2 family protein [Chloroflexia bacterium]